jgi:hypothetical protein
MEIGLEIPSGSFSEIFSVARKKDADQKERSDHSLRPDLSKPDLLSIDNLYVTNIDHFSEESLRVQVGIFLVTMSSSQAIGSNPFFLANGNKLNSGFEIVFAPLLRSVYGRIIPNRQVGESICRMRHFQIGNPGNIEWPQYTIWI